MSVLPEIAPKFGVWFGNELTSKPTPIKFLIDGFIEENITGLIFGPSENGKSLVVLDMAFCMTAGIEWEGRKTKQTEVLIIAGEGHSGYRRRLKALEIKYGIQASNRLMISRASINLADAASCDDVAQFLEAEELNPELIIVDTYHRNMVGDENSSKDFGAIQNNIDRFFRARGAAVILVHHTGHGQDRARGSSSMRAAMDAEFSVFMDRETVTLTCTKGKDMEKPKPMSFALKPVTLDWTISDTDLRPQTSVYLEYVGEVEKRAKQAKLSARDENILQSLTDALNEKGIEPPAEIRRKFAITGTGTFAKVVRIEDWRPYAYKAICGETSNANKKAFQHFRRKYLNKLIEEHNGYIWIIDTYTGSKSKNSITPSLDTGSSAGQIQELPSTPVIARLPGQRVKAGQGGSNNSVTHADPGQAGHTPIGVTRMTRPVTDELNDKKMSVQGIEDLNDDSILGQTNHDEDEDWPPIESPSIEFDNKERF